MGVYEKGRCIAPLFIGLLAILYGCFFVYMIERLFQQEYN